MMAFIVSASMSQELARSTSVDISRHRVHIRIHIHT
jgi:hypothetical protein